MEWVHRNLTGAVLDALTDTPVVLVQGARQTGKSTLVQRIARDEYPARYVTFDDLTALAAAKRDPSGFLSDVGTPVVLDEIQRVAELFLPIKAAIDRDRRPGRYLLTGSANVLLLPQLSDSLAGRMEILTLWPFSQGEMDGVREGFVDAVLSQDLLRLGPTAADRSDVIERVLRGGYPECAKRHTPGRRAAWLSSYVETMVQRQVRDLANIEYLTEIPRLLALLGSRVGGLMNFTQLSSGLGLPQTTVKRYLSLLEMMYLLCPVPAWSANVGKRLIKSPKVALSDTGLAAHLSGVSEEQLADDLTRLGPLLETFVLMELRKQCGWSQARARLFHFRTSQGREVDIVLEDAAGRLVGIEVKTAAVVRDADLDGLKRFRELAGRRFLRGVVLYTGREVVPLGRDLWAVPTSAVWRIGTGEQ